MSKLNGTGARPSAPPWGAMLVLVALGTAVFVNAQGDSHYFRIDRPFLDAEGRRLENFTRVETFGDNQGNGNNDVQWLKVNVDPGKFLSKARQVSGGATLRPP